MTSLQAVFGRTIAGPLSGWRRSLPLWAAVIALEIVIVVAYLEATGTSVDRIRYVVYPFVWINLGAWSVLNIRPATSIRWIRATAAFVAVGYFLLLLVLPGKLGLAFATTTGSGLQVAWAVPGWGPMIAYGGPFVRFHLVPFEVVGYLSLAYLVYANLLNLARSSLAGVVGIATCVGCTVPVMIPLLGLLGGTGTAIASTVYQWSYDLGTALFVVAVVLLYHGLRGANG